MQNERTSILSRMFLVFGLVLLVPFAIGFQMLRIQFGEGDDLLKLWNEQAIDFITIPAERGRIYDSTGSLLVTNTVRYKVAVDPKVPELAQSAKNRQQVYKTLAKFTGRSAAHYRNKVSRASPKSRYVVLADQVGSSAHEALKNLDQRGLILEEQYERTYNFNTLAAHVLGYVNHDNEGMIGLEAYYNDQLKGKDGLQQVRRDRHGRIHAYIGAPRKKPQEGYDLHTTLNANIQAIVQEELEDGVKRNKAKHGTAIVMDPRTGAIKAMANYPTFDPNHPASGSQEQRRNYAIADMIEPGSTFKIVTAIAAYEQGVVDFDDTFKTPDDGRKLIHGQWMRDHDPLGTLSFAEVIEKSSNIATSQIAMELEPRVFYQYARNLGFGTPTNIDLPNESEGKLRKPYEWSQVTLPWMSIGYEVQATPLQILQAYAAFANNGKMMRPHLVDRIVNHSGETVKSYHPIDVRQIADQSTLHDLLPVFEAVVSDSGTAEWAQIDGLSIAGKTGTAQKYKDGRYRFAYRASFVGFFPARQPQYAIMVLLDEPHTSIYGGYTAGPIFKQIALRIAGLDNDIEKQYLEQKKTQKNWVYAPSLMGLQRDEARQLAQKRMVDIDMEGEGSLVVKQEPEPGAELEPNTTITLKMADPTAYKQPEDAGKQYSKIPELKGMSMRSATALLTGLGYQVRIIGSGKVDRQFPKAGALVKRGKTILIRGKQSLLPSTGEKIASQ